MIDRRVAAAIGRRPSLWGETVRTALALAPHRWWRRPPFLPIPERGYVLWRVHTAYGKADAEIEPADVVGYLEWRKRQRSQG